MDKNTEQQLMVVLAAGGALAFCYYLYTKSKKGGAGGAKDSALPSQNLSSANYGSSPYNVSESESQAAQAQYAAEAAAADASAAAAAAAARPSVFANARMMTPSYMNKAAYVAPVTAPSEPAAAPSWTERELALAQAAFAAAGIKVEGTQQAIVALLLNFQKTHNIAQTGILDGATTAELAKLALKASLNFFST